jgi:hypothetical protein
MWMGGNIETGFIENRLWGFVLDSNDYGWRLNVDCNETLGSVKDGDYFDQINDH